MARPVFTRVSTATRPRVSPAMIASRTPSLIWSATLSGWPSVTDSEVKRKSLGMACLPCVAKRARDTIDRPVPASNGRRRGNHLEGHRLEQRGGIRPEPGSHHLVNRQPPPETGPAGQGHQAPRDLRREESPLVAGDQKRLSVLEGTEHRRLSAQPVYRPTQKERVETGILRGGEQRPRASPFCCPGRHGWGHCP